MPTLKNVAKLAGVNVSTVSRYLSGKLAVTPETEKRILEAIEETHYQPNIIAQSLRSGSSKTIAVVAPDIYQPGIAGIICGVDNYIRDTEFLMMIIMTQNSGSRELNILRTLSAMMVGGVIIIGQPTEDINSPEETLEALGDHTPMIFVSRNFEASDVPEVCPDQIDGMMQVTRYLIDKGYKSPGLIVGERGHPDAKMKIQGYRQGLASKGVKPGDEWIAEGFYKPEETRSATEKLLKQNVDAIVCASDLMAISTINYLQDNGLKVPDDIAVTGYGGTSWAEMISPRLTTVDVQVDALGREAIENLINSINGEEIAIEFQVQPVSLRIGESA
jgi:DNA-binding LacI/PurR family transcriptional regulator